MGLKSKLLTLNLAAVAAAVGAALLAGACYLYVSNIIIKPGGRREEVIITEGENVFYQSGDFTHTEIKEIMMELRMNRSAITLDNKPFTAEAENFSANQKEYLMITLSPREANGYIPIAAVVISTFLIVFIISIITAQSKYKRDVITPLLSLKNSALNLREGTLDTPIAEDGWGEVGELAREIERLRLALKDTIHYRNKVDENRRFLITSISHDLKTPVTAIRGYVEGILDGIAASDEKREEYLRNALGKTKLINTMIDDLMLYSKLDLNQMSFEFEETGILKYIEDAVCDNRLMFEKDGMSISAESGFAGDRNVMLDRGEFMRVVQNIFDNARKNMTAGGVLNIILRETNAAVILEFRDSGKGISRADLPHIFDRFYRGDIARSEGGGSGMGLAIAKQIVDAHGGSIWAVSREMKGTSINISLPIKGRGGQYEKNTNH